MQYEEEIAKEAKERQKGGQGGVLLSANLNEANSEPIRTAAEAAKMVGMSENTYRSGKFILEQSTSSEFRQSGQQPPKAMTNFVGATCGSLLSLNWTFSVHLADGQLLRQKSVPRSQDQRTKA